MAQTDVMGDLKKSFGNLAHAGVQPHELEAFETRHGVNLPDDFKAYLLQMNGSSNMDTKMVRFHHLDEMEFQSGKRFLVFADYLIWSHGFGIDLTPGALPTIWLMEPAPAFKIADSYSEFLQRYLKMENATDFYAADPRPRSIIESENLFSLKCSIPVSVILFSWVTQSVLINRADGPALHGYGFPIVWHCWNEASSMERLIHVPYLLIDLAVYLLVVWLILRLVLKRFPLWSPGRATRYVVIAAAVLSVVALSTEFQLDSFTTTLTPISGPDSQVVQRALHVGLDFPY